MRKAVNLILALLSLSVFLLFISGCGDDAQPLGSEQEAYSSAEEALEGLESQEASQDSEALDIALMNLDLSQCDSIENTIIKESCVVNVALKRAEETNDPAECDPIQDTETKDYCLSKIE